MRVGLVTVLSVKKDSGSYIFVTTNHNEFKISEYAINSLLKDPSSVWYTDSTGKKEFCYMSNHICCIVHSNTSYFIENTADVLSMIRILNSN